MKKLLVVCATLVVIAVAGVFALHPPWESSESIRPAPEPQLAGSVSIGSATDQPGLSRLIYGTNQTVGFDADTARWLGANMPQTWTPAFVPVAVDDRIEALKRGQVQLVIQSFTINDARLRDIDMAGPYLVTYQGILVRRGDTSFPNPESVRDRSVCSITGTTGVSELQKRGANVDTFPSVSQCVDRLRSGLNDAVSTDQLILYGQAQRDPAFEVVTGNIFGLGENYGVGLRYGSYDQCVALTNAISRYVNSPEWDDYLDNAFGAFGSFDHTPYRPTKMNTCRVR